MSAAAPGAPPWLLAIFAIWSLGGLIWLAAALWANRTMGTAGRSAQAPYRTLNLIGWIALFGNGMVRTKDHALLWHPLLPPLWRVPAWGGWMLALLAALLTAPVVAREKPVDRDRPQAWQNVLMPRDRARLHGWRQAWLDGLTQARDGGGAAAVDAEGAMLDPDAALNDPDAPDGAYRCRSIKLGALRPGAAAFSRQPGVACRIAGGRFEEIEGPQRVAGTLWRYDGVRKLLLGAMALGDERGALPYGRDAERDMPGLFERIGPRRWRIVLPRPAWEAQVMVIEVVPAD
ncbi:DUF4893 domain-containing protein [Sphingomonas bacterium]|uniref:DUF4893 domain-containing protein n=1 Tax=Sphingomonas bacterium TaxID=1895847 RepID=UPI0015754A67|nr:DUF4893 domain-containing protein [Sphingomonas bacterium]